MSTVYKITKWVCGNTNHNIKPSVMDKEERGQANGARTKHFKDVQISSLLTDLEIKTSPQTKAEIEAAISTLANNKAPGTDSLCAKVLKADPDMQLRSNTPSLWWYGTRKNCLVTGHMDRRIRRKGKLPSDSLNTKQNVLQDHHDVDEFNKRWASPPRTSSIQKRERNKWTHLHLAEQSWAMQWMAGENICYLHRFLKHLRACFGRTNGKYWGIMESKKSWWNSCRSFTVSSPAVSETSPSNSQQNSAFDKDASCQLFSSANWLCNGEYDQPTADRHHQTVATELL